MTGYQSKRAAAQAIDKVNWADHEPDGLAQPEQEPVFIKHHGDAEGWSEWVCPDPKNYFMKCCDCGLVHEAQFGVVRYKSETERDDCDVVDDPVLQAVFRMRRSEEWTADDTAHRAGGMPIAQPEQEPRLDQGPDYERGFVDGMQKQMQSSVDKAVNAMSKRPWVYLTEEHIKEIVGPYALPIIGYTRKLFDQIEAKSKELNT